VPTQLLYFQGRPTVPAGGYSRIVVSESGTLLVSDSLLHLRTERVDLGGRAALSAAPDGRGGWWISTLDGTLLRTGKSEADRLESISPFPYGALWPDPRTGGVFVTRSTERFSFLPEPGKLSLVIGIDGAGRSTGPRGRGPIPAHSLLTSLANTGHAVASGDTVFFAPLSRPGVIALGPAGDTLWTSVPHDPLPAPEPRFAVSGGSAHIDYQPTNLGLTVGPGGKLYLLRAADTTLTRAWLDVLDPATGRTLTVTPVESPRATLAVNALGRIYHLDDFRLLGAIPASARESLAPFDLPALGGGHVTLAGQAGKVVVANFWASWCLPCRTEMPALDTLQRELAGDRFAFLALNEDETRSDAEQFLKAYHFSFPVLLGEGRLKQVYHYPGLPYTLLLDARGRVIRRWIGELSRQDIESIRLLVRAQRSTPNAGTATPIAAPHHHTRSTSTP
jgi:thiol-disulfide isomerase/thioredoxin